MADFFFAIPALDSQAAQDEYNRFCTTHRAVAVERHFVAGGRDSYWAVCVSVATGAGALPNALKASERGAGSRAGGGAASSRVDYRQVLNAADFAVYAELRAWRKMVASEEGVALYTLFTNEQLAEIVRRRVDNLAALGEIEGIGPARLERYGEGVLERLRVALAAPAPAQEPLGLEPTKAGQVPGSPPPEKG